MAAAAGAGALAAPAQSPSFSLTASAAEPGWIALSATGTPGARVRVREHGKTVAKFDLTTATGGRRHGAPWRCDHRYRVFTATETLADGTTHVAHSTVTTPPCNSGIGVLAWPQPPRAGRPLVVTIRTARRTDHRMLRVCAHRPGVNVCHLATFADGGAQAHLVLRHAGAWTVRVTGNGITLERPLTVGRLPLRILATGDSEIQVLDDQLSAALTGQAHVIKEAHISTGLTKLGLFNWLARAKSQGQTIHPDVTIMSIGANDGFNLPGVQGGTVMCCGQGWIDAYAVRVRSMMTSYLRRGAGRVYWFLLPTPRKQTFVPYYQAIDAGILEAAASFPSGVHVVDIRPIFSPGGRYRQYVGSVNAREKDGIHLSAAGDKIALRYLLGLMRADGTL